MKIHSDSWHSSQRFANCFGQIKFFKREIQEYSTSFEAKSERLRTQRAKFLKNSDKFNFSKISNFILGQIQFFKYLDYSNGGTCIVLIDLPLISFVSLHCKRLLIYIHMIVINLSSDFIKWFQIINHMYLEIQLFGGVWVLVW